MLLISKSQFIGARCGTSLRNNWLELFIYRYCNVNNFSLLHIFNYFVCIFRRDKLNRPFYSFAYRTLYSYRKRISQGLDFQEAYRDFLFLLSLFFLLQIFIITFHFYFGRSILNDNKSIERRHRIHSISLMRLRF